MVFDGLRETVGANGDGGWLGETRVYRERERVGSGREKWSRGNNMGSGVAQRERGGKVENMGAGAWLPSVHHDRRRRAVGGRG